jgi:hypothetical protein
MPPEQDEVVVPQENEAAESAELEQVSDPEQEPEEKPEKPPKTFTEEDLNRKIQKRLERAQRSFERKMEAALEQDRAQRAQQSQSAMPQAAPKLEQFDNFDDYVAAKAEYVANQALEKRFAEQRQYQEQEQHQRYRSTVEQSWTQRVGQVRNEIDDFDDVIESAGVEITNVMSEALMDSDLGPKVAYYLAKHPEEAERIAEMTPSAVFRAIGKLEAKIEGDQLTKKKSGAPKPVSPVGSKAGVGTKDPGKMSDEEYAKWRKTARIK